MKKKLPGKWIIVILSGLLTLSGQREAWSQGATMHTQGITQQEFINPAYSSFKDQVTFSVYNRMQWKSEYKNSPETQAANLFVPISTSRLGVNLGLIREDIGLRQTAEFKLSLCHNLRLTQQGYIAFGYSVGFLQNKLNRDNIISYLDEDPTSLLASISEYDSFNPTVSLGLFFLAPKWYMGISSMATNISRGMSSGSQYLPGFDFSGGGLLRLNYLLRFRPTVIVKYYNERGFKSENGVIIKNYKIPPIYDIGANLLFADKVWCGTSYRINQCQTFSVDLLLGKAKIGYTFELGLGDGLYQFNSQGIRLAYSLKHKSGKNYRKFHYGQFNPNGSGSFIY
ncbi:MAG: PorP/SprF family type IX secretion system membrane protein [Prolixibacteraceae bacterium]|nr:PorP/SprF family type IX secretion system membrane protein [Prolixibacteraceae bacterium]